jgi:hypothetical protein
MKGNSQQQVSLIWFVMFAIIAFLLASIAVVSQNDTDEKKWFSKKAKQKTELTEDEEINELNSLINDYEYTDPEETMREKVIRETNERFAIIVGLQEIE